MSQFDLVILYSGGADSRLMVELAKTAKKKFLLLMIDYGQLHKVELEYAAKDCEKNRWSYRLVKLSLPINSGLTGDGIKNTSSEVHEMHVPGRNSIFLSLAFSIAESVDADTIWIGCDWSDRIHLFPDCYQEYLIRMNEAFKFAGPKPINVEAPIIGFTKELVISMLENSGIDMTNVYSGYGDL